MSQAFYNTQKFTLTALVNNQYLVEGITPEQVTVLDGTHFNQLKAEGQTSVELKEFDEAVEKFFAPLIEASQKMEAALQAKEKEDLFNIVLDEGSEAVPATPRRELVLTKDTVILRLIDSGNTSRLRWVKDQIVILDVPAAAQPATPSH